MDKLDRPSFLEVEKALWEPFILLALVNYVRNWFCLKYCPTIKFGYGKKTSKNN